MICSLCEATVPQPTDWQRRKCPNCGNTGAFRLEGTPKTQEQKDGFYQAMVEAEANAFKLVRRALEIGCVVHTCSAKPGAMCDPKPDSHGPPADMDPNKAPWYGVHHRRWLTWKRAHEHDRGILTAAEQVYGCDVCEAPVNVPCMHMRGPGLGKGEPKGQLSMFPDAPLIDLTKDPLPPEMKVEGRVFTKDGYQNVQMTVRDPETIKRLQEGGRKISLGYRGGQPYLEEQDVPVPSRTAGFDHLYDAARYAQQPAAYMTPEQVLEDKVVGIVPANDFQCPAMLAGKGRPAITCRKRRGHPGDHFAPVGDHGAYYTWNPRMNGPLGQMYTLHPPPISDEAREAMLKWRISEEPARIIDATPPENYEAIEKMIRDQLIREGAHLRSVPMPPDSPDDIETVVARPDRVHPGDCSTELPYDHEPGAAGCVASGDDGPAWEKPHSFIPSVEEDGVSCEVCGMSDEHESHVKEPLSLSANLKWFKERAEIELAKNPNMLMSEFIAKIHGLTPLERAYGLDEDELQMALLNVGCDIMECPACAEQFFTGGTSCMHRCKFAAAQRAKLKCLKCGEPTARNSQMCEQHEREVGEEVEEIIQANREINGSSAETRKFAIERMNQLDQHPSLYGHTLEGLCGHLISLLAVSGVRPESQNSFQEFFYTTVRAANERTPGPDNDPYGEVIAHARGIVLGVQMLREGPDPTAPSPIRPKAKT